MNALVLPGGGALGAYQVGFLLYYAESGGEGFDIICGTSVGAINGVGLAHESPENFKAAVDWIHWLWTEKIKGSRSIYKWRRWKWLAALFFNSLATTKPVEKLLTDTIDQERVRQSGVQLRLTAVDLLTNELVVFDESTPDLVKAVMSSASYPLVFPPVAYEGGLYTDGGVRDIAPLSHAIKAGATQILVIRNDFLTTPHKPVNVLDMALQVVNVMSDEIVETDIRECQHLNELAAFGASDRDRVYVKVAKPTKDLGDSLDFDPDLIEMRIEAGYKDAEALYG